MTKPPRARRNKSEQLALFLQQQGRFMTARQVAEAGFRYDDGTVDSVAEIGSIMHKLHQSTRFTVERQESPEPITRGGLAPVMVKVTAIAPRRADGNPADVVGSKPNLWRQLLGKRGSAKVETGASEEAG